MNDQLQEFEPAAKILAATAMSQTFSFCMERKYLAVIGDTSEVAFKLKANSGTDLLNASWMKINQVGKPIDNSAESCFTAIQKILYSCFMPKEMQLLFLVYGEGNQSHLYLGVRTSHTSTSDINPSTQIAFIDSL